MVEKKELAHISDIRKEPKSQQRKKRKVLHPLLGRKMKKTFKTDDLELSITRKMRDGNPAHRKHGAWGKRKIDCANVGTEAVQKNGCFKKGSHRWEEEKEDVM